MRLTAVKQEADRLPPPLAEAVRRAGIPLPDVMLTLLHRPESFGRAFSAALQAVLRGPSAWSIGERELFAAYVSGLNQCRF